MARVWHLYGILPYAGLAFGAFTIPANDGATPCPRARAVWTPP
jgi:hypothetical protein